jgi:hypothetical protein
MVGFWMDDNQDLRSWINIPDPQHCYLMPDQDKFFCRIRIPDSVKAYYRYLRKNFYSNAIKYDIDMVWYIPYINGKRNFSFTS